MQSATYTLPPAFVPATAPSRVIAGSSASGTNVTAQPFVPSAAAFAEAIKVPPWSLGPAGSGRGTNAAAQLFVPSPTYFSTPVVSSSTVGVPLAGCSMNHLAPACIRAAAASTTAFAEVLPGADADWTLIWVSDQAFKPTATNLRAQLETLGCQVKGYKTHKNASRALDKKRSISRTVILVVGSEAPQFLHYLQGRPELAGARVVVESRAAHTALLPSPATYEFAEGFEDAIIKIRRIVSHPSFT